MEEHKPLYSLLSAILEMLQRSTDQNVWGSASVAKTLDEIDGALRQIKIGANPDLDRIRLLFAPTGSLQEISIGNGWAHTFIELSIRFDALFAGRRSY